MHRKPSVPKRAQRRLEANSQARAYQHTDCAEQNAQNHARAAQARAVHCGKHTAWTT